MNSLKLNYDKLKEAMNSLKLNYDKLKIKYDKKEQRCVTLEKGMKDLRIKLAKAEGRLAQHDNPHTPSSKKPIGQKNNGIVSNKPEGKPKKPGAQKGHQGVIAALEKICNEFWIPENIRFTINVDARVLQKV